MELLVAIIVAITMAAVLAQCIHAARKPAGPVNMAEVWHSGGPL